MPWVIAYFSYLVDFIFQRIAHNFIMDDATNYHLLKTLEANPELTQRDLAREMGISLGKTNYCLRALTDKGLVKARNFKNAKNKTAYIYKLTPQGIEEKAKVAYRFLRQKQREFERLKQEIEELREECEGGKV